MNGIFFENEKISDNTNKQYKKVQSDSKKKQKNDKIVKKILKLMKIIHIANY